MDNELESRKILIEHFSSQINLHAQITGSLIIALFVQGIYLTYVPDGLKLPVFFFGSGFLGGLTFLQWGKVYWYSRLWNATLVANPTTIENVYKQKPDVSLFKETDISKIYLGVLEIVSKTCSQFGSIWIFFSKEILKELIFCIFSALWLTSLAYWVEPFFLNSQFEIMRFVFFLVVSTIFSLVLIYVINKKCCSDSQITYFLRSADLEKLAGVTQ